MKGGKGTVKGWRRGASKGGGKNIGGHGDEKGDEDWLLIGGTPTTTPEDDDESRRVLLDLKKRVWQLRICQRKSVRDVVDALEDSDEDIVEAQVESYTAQVESFRNSMGVQWTWFEEELFAGSYDKQLLSPTSGTCGSPTDPSHLLLPPAHADEAPALSSVWGPFARAPRPPRSPKMASTATGKSPNLRPAPEVVKKNTMPCPEVWLAAKAHHKSNFFAAAVWGSSRDDSVKTTCKTMLFSVLQFGEVSEAIGLALASRSFAASLLGAGATCVGGGELEVAVEHLWCLLGAYRGTAGSVPAHSSSVCFYGDPSFRIASWARRQAFHDRVARGLASPAVVVQSLRELAGDFAELGPFLEPQVGDEALPGLVGADGAEGDGLLFKIQRPLGPDRLVVCDGRQSFQVVDVGRQRLEEVPEEKAKFNPEALRASMGVHDSAVTASWPVRGQPHCAASGGILAAQAPTTRGASAPKTANASAQSLQWLELPTFAPEVRAAGGTDHVPPTTPKMGPSSSLSSDPKTPKSPKVAARGDGAARSSAPQLCRNSVLQEDLCAACSSAELTGAPAAGASGQTAGGKCKSPTSAATVEAMWPLPGRLVLISVHKAFLAGGASKAASPPRRGAGAKALSSNRPFERQVSNDMQELFDGSGDGEHWLQVWELPELPTLAGGKAAVPAPVAAARVASQVTAIDVDCRLTGQGGSRLLCGFACGAADLRALPSCDGGHRQSDFAAPLASWTIEVGDAGAPVTHVLLRGSVDQGEQTTAVLAEAGRVVARTLPRGSDGADSQEQIVLPQGRALPKAQAHVQVVALQPVGSAGFAVCCETRVYAFEVWAAGPMLTAAVDLTQLATPSPSEPSVSHFSATLYDFCVVFKETSAAHGQDRNAFCVQWPRPQRKDADQPSVEADDSQRRRFAVQAWSSPAAGSSSVRGAPSSTGQLSRCQVPAVCLNEVLLGRKDLAPIGAMALHTPRAGVDRSQAGSGLLAISAQGGGVSVFRWGVEASPELTRLRERNQRQAMEADAQRHREHCKCRLQRLQQRLQETQRLQDKLAELGAEALSPDEHAKIQRRGQVEVEIDRLSLELGVHEGKDHDEESGEEDIQPFGAGPQRTAEEMAAVRARRQEKEKEQKKHHDDKRKLQKERQKNRDRKFTD